MSRKTVSRENLDFMRIPTSLEIQKDPAINMKCFSKPRLQFQSVLANPQSDLGNRGQEAHQRPAMIVAGSRRPQALIVDQGSLHLHKSLHASVKPR